VVWPAARSEKSHTVEMKLAAGGRSSEKIGMNQVVEVAVGVVANVVVVVEDVAAVVVGDSRSPDVEASACQAHTGCVPQRHERNCGGSLRSLVVKDRPVGSRMVGSRKSRWVLRQAGRTAVGGTQRSPFLHHVLACFPQLSGELERQIQSRWMKPEGIYC
jgi:hypothetical protein